MADIRIDLLSIFNYIGDQSRCIKEGEEVLNAGNIFCCGISCKKEDSLEVFALCLQTCKLSDKPHEINLEINREKFQVKCSCKAGLSGKCKHCLAVLLLVNREELSNLDDISSTELAQQWGKLKTRALDKYQPIPVSSFCHVKTQESIYFDPSLQLDIMRELCSFAPNSALNAHIEGRQCTITTSKEISDDLLPDILPDMQHLVQVFHHSELQNSVIKEFIEDCENVMCESCTTVYETVCFTEKDQYLHLCLNTIEQSKGEKNSPMVQKWRAERRKRITASTCYGLYTYTFNRKPCWDQKIAAHLNPKFEGNSATRNGIRSEAAALRFYEDWQNCEIKKCGLFINACVSWLACSPDGLRFKGNKPDILIEIKCPLDGTNMHIQELTLNYLTRNANGDYKLRKKHKYYGQVQLSLLLLNLKMCHLVVFSTFEKQSAIIVEVPFDESFATSLLRNLKIVYFRYLLLKLVQIINPNSLCTCCT